MANFRSLADAGGSSSSVTCGAPSGVSVGDQLVAVVFGCGAATSSTLTAPSGWTVSVPWTLFGADGGCASLCVKTAGASEPGSYTFSISPVVDGVIAAVILDYDITAGIDGTIETAFSAGASSFAGPSISPSGPDETIIAVYLAANASNVQPSITLPGGLTSRLGGYTALSGIYSETVAVGDYTGPTSGSTAPGTASVGQSDAWGAFTIALSGVRAGLAMLV